MDKSTDIGMNRTGVDMKPMKSEESAKGALKYSPDFTSTTNLAREMRRQEIEASSPIGTVPLPGKAKGVLKTGAKAFKGKDVAIFIDKLGERLAFERAGVRLYEAVIQKAETVGMGKASVGIDRLKRFQQEEGQHFQMLTECLRKLGADPTSMTPSADVAGVAAQGHMKIIGDPRTSVAACIHSILALELEDNDSWEMLVEMANSMGEKAMAEKFQKALREEQEHLAGIRQLYKELVKSEEAPMNILQ